MVNASKQMVQSKTFRGVQDLSQFKKEQRATHFKMGYEGQNAAPGGLSHRTQSAAMGNDNKRSGLYDQWRQGAASGG